MKAEEKLIVGLFIGLFIMGILIYICPESFFMYYDKILHFLEVI
jgi:hypothetical protein